jgi:hypothetical protein
MHIGFWWESQKERDQQEDLEVGGRIVLRWIFGATQSVLRTSLIGLVQNLEGFINLRLPVNCWR